jgi:hypothetical protein
MNKLWGYGNAFYSSLIIRIAGLQMIFIERILGRRIITLLMTLTLLCLFIWGGNQPLAAGLFPTPWDKLVHLAWFAVLSGLLRIGLNIYPVGWVFVFCAGVAVWDEWRQLTLPGRSADLDDLLFDGMGLVVGLVVARWLNTYLYKQCQRC